MPKGKGIMGQDGLFTFVLEHMNDMVLCFDKNGIITYGNQSAIEKLEYTYGVEEVAIREVFPDLFWATETGIGTDVEFNEEIQESVAYRQNKTCFPVEVSFSEMNGDYVCMVHDITRKNFLEKKIKQVEQDAEDAMKVKSEFVANVTHELRTPVNGLLGNTRELMTRVTDTECQKMLSLMERSCGDMNSIINNILDFSKLEAGKFTIEKREFDFRKMIDYVKSNHAHKITEKGLKFFVTISPAVPETIISDELRIVQVLNNLLSNAVKFTSVGKIALEIIKTAQVGDKAELFFIVTDTGIGMDKNEQDKLFKSFSQVDASISRKYGGTGLGLNICKQLVDLMNGQIEVQSEKNKGTMFSFSIWVDVPESEQNEETATVDLTTYMSEMSGREQEELRMMEYGSAENTEELEKNISKFVLCVEMDNWEKAETFMVAIKQLTEQAPQEIRSAILRLKMAVQKADYDKTMAAYEVLKGLL